MRISVKPLAVAGILLGGSCQNPNEAGADITGTRRLSVGAATACALDPTGKVYCWGVNSSQMEYGSYDVLASESPVAIPMAPLRSLSSGWGQHRCGLTATVAVCWGRGQSGQIGN